MNPGFLFLVLIVVVVFAGIVMLGRRRLPTAGRPVDHDALLIEHLRNVPSDLTRPHEIDFFIVNIPTEEAASALLVRASSEGFRGEMTNHGEGDWGCELHKTLVPSHTAMSQQRQILTKLAAEAGGEYDGWGTEAVSG